MPVHDWTRVSAGTFHDFHNRLIAHLTEALNTGLLEPAYDAAWNGTPGDWRAVVEGREPPPTADGRS